MKAFLELQHERLACLELDFIDWAEVEHHFNLPDDDEDGNYSTPLTDLILPKHRDCYKGFLPNLQSFSLSAASLRGSWDRIIHAFNLHRVKELRLRNCRFAIELLENMAQTNLSLHVTRVELVLRHSELTGMEYNVIGFLAPFNGLKDLFLLFDCGYANEYYAKAILYHRDTLRRVVFHRRHFCIAVKAPYSQQYCDSSLEGSEGELTDVFRETTLESAGICGEPSTLQKSFQSIAYSVDSLRLLHLRFTGKAKRKPRFFEESNAYGDSPSSDFMGAWLEALRSGTTPPRPSPGPSEAEFRIRWEQIQGENWREDEDRELEAFADWAFGPDGFPRLQVLASGDFSYGNRFAGTHTLWRRDTGGSQKGKTWRMVEQSDIAENELIDANMDMMSACPVSPLFYRYGRGDDFPGIS